MALDVIVKVLQGLAALSMGIYWTRKNLKDKELR